MNNIIKITLILSILYWTMFYLIPSNGFWLPIPFILIVAIWFYNYNKKDYTERYELKQNNSKEYYIWDNKNKKAKSLSNNGNWYCKNDDCFHYCLTKNKETAELYYNRLIS